MVMPPGMVAVVNNDAAVLKTLGQVLAAFGYRVSLLSSAEEYLQAAAASEASCVVIDIDLGPGMSGLDLGRAIAASGRALPIIFLTSASDPLMRQHAADIGCVALLPKPCSSELLIVSVIKARLGNPPPSAGSTIT